MTFRYYKNLIVSDLYRYGANNKFNFFFKMFFFNPGFKYSFWMRTAKFLKGKGNLYLPFYAFARFWLGHLQYKFGIAIPYNTDIGSGFYIGHFGGIVINYETKIGRNCNVNQGVTIGAAYGGKNPGVPSIGDNVFIGAHSVIIGGIQIGNNVAIGASSVVTKSFPENAVVAGNPARIISYNSSRSYVSNTDY